MCDSLSLWLMLRLWIVGDIGLAGKGILIEIAELFSISSPTPQFMKDSAKAFRHPQMLTTARDWLIHQAGNEYF